MHTYLYRIVVPSLVPSLVPSYSRSCTPIHDSGTLIVSFEMLVVVVDNGLIVWLVEGLWSAGVS